MVSPESIKTGIESGLACERVEVIGDGQHFQALGERMREEIHALSMQTLTPEEAKSNG